MKLAELLYEMRDLKQRTSKWQIDLIDYIINNLDKATIHSNSRITFEDNCSIALYAPKCIQLINKECSVLYENKGLYKEIHELFNVVARLDKAGYTFRRD